MISDDDLLKVLLEWNLWKKDIDTGIPRKEYIKKYFPLVKRKEIIVIKGIRRTGKSTIMLQFMKELIKNKVNKNQLLYLNLEDYNLRESLNLNLLEQVIKVYKNYTNNEKKIYFFIDEIQYIKEWEKFLRTKYDLNENIKFIISGSNASLLSNELSTLLTGRNLTFQVKTLDLKEYYDFKPSGNFDEYLTYGGFPEVVLEDNILQKKNILQHYFDDIVNKDIISRHKLRNIELIQNLCRYLVANSGAKMSLNKLSKSFGVSDETISNYISYMIDAYLLIKVPFFSYSLKKKFNVLTQPKYYSPDNGLIYITNINFSQDLGKKYENIVLLKIYQENKNISYWSEGKSEVDFIVDNNAINVTATNKIHERELKGLKDFSKIYKNFNLILITKSLKEEIMIPINDFLNSLD